MNRLVYRTVGCWFFSFSFAVVLDDNAAHNVPVASAVDTAVTDVTAAVDIPWVSPVSYSLMLLTSLLLRQLLLTSLKSFAETILSCCRRPYCY
jgi:hypothetical protein